MVRDKQNKEMYNVSSIVMVKQNQRRIKEMKSVKSLMKVNVNEVCARLDSLQRSELTNLFFLSLQLLSCSCQL